MLHTLAELFCTLTSKPTATCWNAAPDYLLIVTRGCENKNRSQREKNKLRSRPCRVLESVPRDVIQPGCIGVIVTVARRQKNLLELRQLEPQGVQACQSSVAHTKSLIHVLRIVKNARTERGRTSSSSFPAPTRASHGVPPPTTTCAQNSWTTTKSRKRKKLKCNHAQPCWSRTRGKL